MVNQKLYQEGLRQSFLVGIFIVVISTIINCIPPLLVLTSSQNHTDLVYYNGLVSSSTLDANPALKEIHAHQYELKNPPQKIEIETANLPMLVLMFVIPIVMIFVQFGFLGDRKACDFYHSIPVTRLSLVVSYSLSALTFTILGIIIPMLANGLLYSFCENVAINYTLLLPNIIEKVILAFLIYSALLIGTALSSQVITSCLVAITVLLLPRFVVTMLGFTIKVHDSGIYTTDVFLGNIFGNHLNLLVTKFTNIWDKKYSIAYLSQQVSTTEDFEVLSYSLNSYIYTLVLALVLFAIGCFTFVKRKSEMAGQNTPNKLTQHIIRIALVLPIIVYSVAMSNMDDYFYKQMFTLMIVTLIIYYTYELISMRNTRSMYNATLALPVVVVLAFGINGIVEAGIENTKAQPNVAIGDIKSVNIDFNIYLDDNYMSNPIYDSYTSNLISNYNLDDAELINFVHDGMNNYFAYLNDKNSDYRYSLPVYVKLNTNSKNIETLTIFEEDTTELILGKLFADEHITQTLLTQLPDKSNVVSGRTTSLGQYTYDEIQSIIDVLYQEYNSLTFEQKLEVSYGHNNEVNDFLYYNDSRSDTRDIHASIMYEMQRRTYSLGEYKEAISYSSTNSDPYDFFTPAASYNANDKPIVLSLFTKDNLSKFIYISDLLPQTKKLIVDMFYNSNQENYKIFDYVVNTDNTFYNFNVSSLDDSYNFATQMRRDYHLYNQSYNPYNEALQFIPNAELYELFNTALDRISTSIDYDNLYIIAFNGNIDGITLNSSRILLPFTQEEYENIILNIEDYATILGSNNQPLFKVPQGEDDV